MSGPATESAPSAKTNGDLVEEKPVVPLTVQGNGFRATGRAAEPDRTSTKPPQIKISPIRQDDKSNVVAWGRTLQQSFDSAEVKEKVQVTMATALMEDNLQIRVSQELERLPTAATWKDVYQAAKRLVLTPQVKQRRVMALRAMRPKSDSAEE